LVRMLLSATSFVHGGVGRLGISSHPSPHKKSVKIIVFKECRRVGWEVGCGVCGVRCAPMWCWVWGVGCLVWGVGCVVWAAGVWGGRGIVGGGGYRGA